MEAIIYKSLFLLCSEFAPHTNTSDNLCRPLITLTKMSIFRGNEC